MTNYQLRLTDLVSDWLDNVGTIEPLQLHRAWKAFRDWASAQLGMDDEQVRLLIPRAKFIELCEAAGARMWSFENKSFVLPVRV